MTAPEMPGQIGAGLIKSITGTFQKALKDVKKAVVGAKKTASKRKPVAKKAKKSKKSKK
jgi:hypothetical protein